jgi:virginiamycin B lyase
MTVGPDGNLWVTAVSQIVVVSPNGIVVARRPTVAPANQIVLGSDGNLWYTYDSVVNNSFGPAISKMSPAGIETDYKITNSDFGYPYGITAGADGRIWFGQSNASRQLGAISTTGVFSYYLFPPLAALGNMHGMALGSDNNVWFLSQRQLAKASSAGVISSYDMGVDVGGNSPYGIVGGPDGNLWFLASYKGTSYANIGEASTSGQLLHLWPCPTNCSPWSSITSGPDGNLWIDDNAGHLWRLTTSGQFTEFDAPVDLCGAPGTCGLYEVVIGSDHQPWFPISNMQKIVRFDPSAQLPAASQSPGASPPYVGPTPSQASQSAGPSASTYPSPSRLTSPGMNQTHVAASFPWQPIALALLVLTVIGGAVWLWLRR